MKSNKQRRKEIQQKRIARAEKLKRELANTVPPYALGLDNELTAALSGAVASDKNELTHNSSFTIKPDYYLDKAFTCIDCESREVWTAKQQKWWYEIAKGDINSTAVRCRPCRKIKQAIKAEARRIHLEGVERKKNVG